MPYFRAIADGLPTQTRVPGSPMNFPPPGLVALIDAGVDNDIEDGAVTYAHAPALRPPLPTQPSGLTESDSLDNSNSNMKSLASEAGPSTLISTAPATPTPTPGALSPMPATPTNASSHSPASGSGSRRSQRSRKSGKGKRVGWVQDGLRVHWARFLRRVGGGDDGEGVESESVVGGTDDGDDEDENEGRIKGEGSGGSGEGRGRGRRRTQVQVEDERWERERERKQAEGGARPGTGRGTGGGNGPGYGAGGYNADYNANVERDDDAETVDEVVVDRAWGRSLTGYGSDSTDTAGDGDSAGKGGGVGGDHHHGTTHTNTPGHAGHTLGSRTSNTGGRDSPSAFRLNGHGHSEGTDGLGARFWTLCLPLSLVRYRLYPQALVFFSAKFYDAKAEARYRKEAWFQSKVSVNCEFFVLLWGSHVEDWKCCAHEYVLFYALYA